MISQWLDAQPEERQTALRERFRQAAALLEEAGIAQTARELKQITASGRESLNAIGLEYFALGIACPFLEDERCIIHPIRPMRCREYLVVSPAEHCSHPEGKEIAGVRPPILLSQFLGRWNENGDRQPAELILLTMLEEWLASHPAEKDSARRTAPEMLKEFLDALAGDSQARGTATLQAPQTDR